MKAVTNMEQGFRQLVSECMLMSAVMYVCCTSVSNIVMSKLVYKRSKTNIYSVMYMSCISVPTEYSSYETTAHPELCFE
jgi:hypothetical protein